MSESRDRDARAPEDERRESGLPGGGAGRKDEVGGSGVYPASAGKAPKDAELKSQAAWGQGDRGPAGAEDSGSSELFFYEAELKAVGEEGGTPLGGEEKKTPRDHDERETPRGREADDADPDDIC